jgi:hypothetical protein
MYIVGKGCGYATGMKLKLPTIHLKRYEEIAALLWKYGRTDLVRQTAGPIFGDRGLAIKKRKKI